MNEYQKWVTSKPTTDRERKDKRYEINMKVLNSSGVSYKFLSEDHIRIADKIDFWPTTGRWRDLKEKKSHHGGTESIYQALYRLRKIHKASKMSKVNAAGEDLRRKGL